MIVGFRQAPMNKTFSLVLLVGGTILAIYGFQAANSFGSDVSRFFTGSPTDKSIWMLIGGIVAIIAGLAGTFRTSRQG